jgi:hypothetical protein
MKARPIIGWKEWIHLPEWGISWLSAKCDTGAKGAALDVVNLHEAGDGQIEFDVILDRGELPRTNRVGAAVLGQTKVRSSNGLTQTRYRVQTIVRLGEFELPVVFSLVNRERMLHRVLLGRQFLAGRFLVDSKRQFLLGKK